MASLNQSVDNTQWVQKLPPLEFFSSDTITIPFKFVDGDGTPIDLRILDIYWFCAPYGRFNEPELIISSHDLGKDGVPKITVNQLQPNICYVHLDYQEIGALRYVKYTHQPVLMLTSERGQRRYLRAEGDIIFRPYIRDFY